MLATMIFETNASFAFWIFCALYSLYKFYSIHEDLEFQNFINQYEEISPGWSWLNRKKDISDDHWKSTSSFLLRAFPWLILHSILTENLPAKSLPTFHLSFSTIFLFVNFPPAIAAIFHLQVFLFYAVSQSKQPWMVILTAIFVHLLYTYLPEGYEDIHTIYSGITWCSLRCYMAAVDEMKEHRGLLHFCAYVLYLPLLFPGPIVPYSNYECCLKTHNLALPNRVQIFLRTLTKLAVYYIVTEISMHFVYIPFLFYFPEVVGKFDNWTLFGYGIAMGHYFHIKYLMYYGYSTMFASFEGVAMPLLPRCVSTIHLYSYMWKYFDNGLYKFLKIYIYVPTMRSLSLRCRVTSTFLCFLLIFWWHGANFGIFVWTVTNFVAILLEITCKSIPLSRHLDEPWRRRLECLMATPLLVVSIISNFIFLSNYATGLLYAQRILNADLQTWLLVFAVMYAMCQCAAELRCREYKQRRINS